MASDETTGTTQTTTEAAATAAATTARHGAGIDRSEEWAQLRARHLRAPGERPASAARGVPVHEEGGTSLYLQGPDGERIELIADPLGEMYGSPVV